jgi:hypothetical protein
LYVAVYRSPSSNYSTLLTKIELILQKICKNNVKVIICGDINVNFMDDCPTKRQLEILLSSFNLSSIVTFPTRIGLNKSTIIDNIFIDEQQYDGYDIFTVSNGLSDHEAQLLVLNLPAPIIIEKHINYIRNINNYNINDFQTKLSYENWESVFNNSDINTSLNVFLNIYVIHFYSSFPLKQIHNLKSNSWITSGIVVSCRRKRVLYEEVKKSNNQVLQKYYKNYCRILNTV